MDKQNYLRVIETLLLGFIGGYVFQLLQAPLPWVLGSLTFVMLWQGFSKRTMAWPSPIKNSGLIILGLYFGLYFTAMTIVTVLPYLPVFLLLTIVLILFSIIVSILVTRWINVDQVTSVFGCIPGGLTEMVIASESLKANTSLVVIFQTVRLMAVLFIVPAIIVLLFSGSSSTSSEALMVMEPTMEWGYTLYIIPIIVGVFLRNILPAGIVIVPLFVTALINIAILELPTIPPLFLIAAQVAVGISLGKNISFNDLRLGGRHCYIYLFLSILIIGSAFALGSLLAAITSIDLATAILSIAPGGLIEMVLTASLVGADPAIVSSLQLTRILIIIVFVPSILKWYFNKKMKTTDAIST